MVPDRQKHYDSLCRRQAATAAAAGQLLASAAAVMTGHMAEPLKDDDDESLLACCRCRMRHAVIVDGQLALRIPHIHYEHVYLLLYYAQ